METSISRGSAPRSTLTHHERDADVEQRDAPRRRSPSRRASAPRACQIACRPDAGQQHERQQRVQDEPGELLARPRVDGQREQEVPDQEGGEAAGLRRHSETAPIAPSISAGHSIVASTTL